MGLRGDERSGLGHLSCELRDGWTDYLTKAFSEVIADLKNLPSFSQSKSFRNISVDEFCR